MEDRLPSVIGLPDDRARLILSRAGFTVESVSITGPAGEDWRVVRQRPAGEYGVSLVLAARKPEPSTPHPSGGFWRRGPGGG